MNRIITLLLITACNTSGDTPPDDPETSGFIETTESTGSESSSEGDTTESGSESSSGEESTESTGSQVGCEEPVEPRGEHEPCGLSCLSECEPETVCRWSYAGGWLAECEAKCGDDSQCSDGDVCSANHCVTPCGPASECAEGFFCYPGKTLEGVQLEDPAHPLPHCMPLAG
jgi:hypothetical protein